MNADFARAERAFASKDYVAAIAAYEEVQKSDPQNQSAMRQMGLAYSFTGNTVDAQRFLEQARSALPSDTIARLALGKLYLDDAKPDKAIAEANALLSVSPYNTDALRVLGSGYLNAQQPQAAVDVYRKLARLLPNDSSAAYVLGVALAAVGNAPEAAQQFEKSLALAPHFLEALTQLVEVNLAAGRGNDAIARVKQQIAAVGSTPPMDELLAIAYLGAGDTVNSERTLRKVIAGAQGYIDPYVRLSELYRSTGHFDDALTTVDAALKIDPKNLSVRLVQGVTYEAKGDTSRATRAYEQALQVDARFVPAINNLATLLAEKKATRDRALQLVIHAREIEPGNVAVLDTYGWVLYQRGEIAKALTVLTDVAMKLPNEPTVAYHLGMAQMKSGDAVSARREFARALTSSAHFAERSATERAFAVAGH